MKDLTLEDYIKRTMERIEKEKSETLAEQQQNPNQYPVYPEDDGTDSKKNPYSDV